MNEHCVSAQPAWWQSALELRAASVELYMQFLVESYMNYNVCARNKIYMPVQIIKKYNIVRHVNCYNMCCICALKSVFISITRMLAKNVKSL